MTLVTFSNLSNGEMDRSNGGEEESHLISGRGGGASRHDVNVPFFISSSNNSSSGGSSRRSANRRGKTTIRATVRTSARKPSTSYSEVKNAPHPTLAAKYLSQTAAAAAAAWENNIRNSTVNGGRAASGKNKGTGSANVAFGPSRPPSSQGSGGGQKHSSSSVSFGSLDLAAKTQSSGGASDFFMAATGAADVVGRRGVGGPNHPPCSEAEMKALMSMFVEIMGMSMDPEKALSKNITQAARNFLAVATANKNNNQSNNCTNNTNFTSGGTFNFTSSSVDINDGSAYGNFSSASSGGGDTDVRSSFPIFMFGGCRDSNSNSNSDSSTCFSSTMTTPPGGCPREAAVAVAATGMYMPGSGDLNTDCNEDTEENKDYDDGDDEFLPNLDNDLKEEACLTQNPPTWNTKNNTIEIRKDSLKSSRSKRSPNHAMTGFSLAVLEEVELDDALQEDEKARKAAKKRVKKQRKKDKAKKEAALKAAHTALKKHEKLILSWRSRVVAACQSNETAKVESLLSESPLRSVKQEQLQSRQAGEEDIKKEEEKSKNSTVLSMEFFLPNCIARSREQVEKGSNTRQRLASYVLATCISVAFNFGRSGRMALHTACFAGDIYFVRLLIDRCTVVTSAEAATSDTKGHKNNMCNNTLMAESGRNHHMIIPEKYLDILCKNSGWSPLHYAAAVGSIELIEVLLASGCNVNILTDPKKTCRRSHGEGITAQELVDIIQSGRPSETITCSGDSLQEIIETNGEKNSLDQRRRFRLLEKISERLADVEENGFSPSQCKSKDNSDYSLEGLSSQTISTNITSKKRKKKKKKALQQEHQQAESVDTDTSKPISKKKADSFEDELKDPMIAALLGMGFTNDQIYAAAKACGGFDRATADDLVNWIFGQESNEIGDGEASSSTTSDDSNVDCKSWKGSTKNNDAELVDCGAVKHQKQKTTHAQEERERASAKVHRERLETAKQEEKTRVASQLRFAKKEQQRRRNRDWNNREQARQKSEALAKLAQEMDRRARAEAQKVVMEKMVVQHKHHHQQQIMMTTAQSSDDHVAYPRAAAEGQHGSTRFGNSPANASDVQRGPPGNHGQPGAYPVFKNPGDFHSQMSTMNVVPPGYDEGNKRHPSVMQSMHADIQCVCVCEDSTVSSAGSGRCSTRVGPSTPLHSANPPTPPPGFRQTPSTGSASTTTFMKFKEETQCQYFDETNPLGEIRATAKVFVPSNFKPAISSGSNTIRAVNPVLCRSSLAMGVNGADAVLESNSSSPVGSFLSGDEAPTKLAPCPMLASGNYPDPNLPSSVVGDATTTPSRVVDPIEVGGGSSVGGGIDKASLLAASTASSIWGDSNSVGASTTVSILPSLSTFGDRTKPLGSDQTGHTFAAIDSIFGGTDSNSKDGSASTKWGCDGSGGNLSGMSSIW